MLEITSTTNPIFRSFPASGLQATGSRKRMRFSGVARKTILLAVWTIVPAVAVWKFLQQGASANPFDAEFYLALLAMAATGPFTLLIISIWKKPAAPITAPLYAVFQGLFLGFFSVPLERSSPGVAMQAICITCCTCIVLACCYQFGLVRASDQFTKKIRFVPAGAAVYLVIAFLLSRYGLTIFPIVLHGRGAGICVLVAVFGSTTLISGYDLAAKAAEQNHPEYMEWYAALGLILSLVWLYLEGIRFFFKGRIPNLASRPPEEPIK
jgi:uncharacterized YccA/Bax inhibitor family protein